LKKYEPAVPATMLFEASKRVNTALVLSGTPAVAVVEGCCEIPNLVGTPEMTIDGKLVALVSAFVAIDPRLVDVKVPAAVRIFTPERVSEKVVAAAQAARAFRV